MRTRFYSARNLYGIFTSQRAGCRHEFDCTRLSLPNEGRYPDHLSRRNARGPGGEMMYALWTLPWSRSDQPRAELKFARLRKMMPFPTAPEIAADALLSDLDARSTQALTQIELEHLPHYDRPLGDYCRDVLGLDGRNEELIKACGHSDPNEAIAVVVRLAWIRACEKRNSRRGRSNFSP